jgi:sortase A
VSESADYAAAVGVRTILRGVGKTLIGAGLIVLLFVAYELWGTGFIASSHQNALRQQFNQKLRAHQVPVPSTGATSPPVSTPTTVPILPIQTPVAPPTEGQPIGIIDIPKIGANFVVVEGTGEADLERGPGHYQGTALPGNPGNAAIAGHRTTYLKPFYNLDQMAPGDPIYITTTQGRFQYSVVDTLIVSPDRVDVLKPTPTPTLTLTTCNPRFSASTRMVVQAKLVTPAVAALPVTKPVSPAPSLDTGPGGWLGATLWGLACVVLGIGMWLAWRRLRKWWVPVVGVAGLLVLLFIFFGAVNPLLPQGY